MGEPKLRTAGGAAEGAARRSAPLMTAPPPVARHPRRTGRCAGSSRSRGQGARLSENHGETVQRRPRGVQRHVAAVGLEGLDLRRVQVAATGQEEHHELQARAAVAPQRGAGRFEVFLVGVHDDQYRVRSTKSSTILLSKTRQISTVFMNAAARLFSI